MPTLSLLDELDEQQSHVQPFRVSVPSGVQTSAPSTIVISENVNVWTPPTQWLMFVSTRQPPAELLELEESELPELDDELLEELLEEELLDALEPLEDDSLGVIELDDAGDALDAEPLELDDEHAQHTRTPDFTDGGSLNSGS